MPVARTATAPPWRGATISEIGLLAETGVRSRNRPATSPARGRCLGAGAAPTEGSENVSAPRTAAPRRYHGRHVRAGVDERPTPRRLVRRAMPALTPDDARAHPTPGPPPFQRQVLGRSNSGGERPRAAASAAAVSGGRRARQLLLCGTAALDLPDLDLQSMGSDACANRVTCGGTKSCRAPRRWYVKSLISRGARMADSVTQ